MKQTQNLGLKLPEGSDWADVTALNENMEVLDAAVAGKADVGEDGKIPASQLPEMNYDPAGSAAAVQANLTAHTGNTSNPHGVTAEQAGAIANPIAIPNNSDLNNYTVPGLYCCVSDSGAATLINCPISRAFSLLVEKGANADCVQTLKTYVSGSTYTSEIWVRCGYPNWGVGWVKIPTLDSNGYLSVSNGGTGVGSIAALASLLAGQGLGKMTVGSYVGTGVMGPSNPNSITCAFPIKAVFMMRIGMLPCGLGYFNKSGSWYYTSIIESMYTAQSGFQQNIGFGHDNSFTKRYAQFSSDRKTVSWYCVYDDATDNPGAQFNEAGETYDWIAFG